MGDGREDAMADHVIANAPAGDVSAAVDAIDDFAYDKSILMNVGDEKGQLLDAAVRRANPKLAMELGAYCGYSGLRIARAAPAARVFSIEKSGANASVARRVWAHAGLTDRVTCINGTVDDGTTLEILAKDYGFTEGCLDFVFLDHWKDVYLDDLQRLVSRGRQRRHPRRTQVPRLHEGTTGQAVANHRTRDPRRVSDATQRPGSGVGVPGLSRWACGRNEI
jgi:catechol O-methyltransferase